jgi:proline dehydrogenase
MSGSTTLLRRLARSGLEPLLRRAAQHYIAGPKPDDARSMAKRLATGGFSSTLGFWDGTNDTPQGIQARYLDDVAWIAGSGLDSYASLKLPALKGCDPLIEPVVELAIEHGVRLHFDSHSTADADPMWHQALAAARRGAKVSCTIPGRWRRSFDDCRQAVEAGIRVRVVKGQWADDRQPEADLREGFLAVVEALAGSGVQVALATHDAELAEAAIGRLRSSGTDCQWELLYGLAYRKPLTTASNLDVSVRFYIPYGEAYLPYCLSKVRQNPGLMGQLMLDAFSGLGGSDPMAAIYQR